MRHAPLLVLVSMVVVAANVQAAQPTTTLRDHPGVSAVMEIDVAACPATLPVTIRAASESEFSKDSNVLLKIMGWARIIGATSCPSATAIRLTGTVSGQPIYKGIALRSNNWALAQINTEASALPPPRKDGEPSVAVASAADVIGQCDDLAAHPKDPDAAVKGMDDAMIDGASVVVACEAATKLSQDAPRLRFQLARGYLKVGRFEDAVEQLLSAAEDGHGGALAYLADLHVSGAPGIEADPVLARSLYTRAAESGFTPAKVVLDEYEDYTEEVAKAEREEREFNAFIDAGGADAPGFHHPALMAGIYSGNFGAISEDELDAKRYVLNIAGSIAAVCEKHFTKRDVEHLEADAAFDAVDLTPEGTAVTVVGGFLELARMVSGDPTEYMKKETHAAIDRGHLFDESMADSTALFSRLPCGSAGLERFSKNIRSFVKNEDTPRASQRELMQACQASAPGRSRDRHFQFCGCLLGVTQYSMPISRADREGMTKDFWPAMRKVIDKDPSRFRICYGN